MSFLKSMVPCGILFLTILNGMGLALSLVAIAAGSTSRGAFLNFVMPPLHAFVVIGGLCQLHSVLHKKGPPMRVLLDTVALLLGFVTASAGMLSYQVFAAGGPPMAGFVFAAVCIVTLTASFLLWGAADLIEKMDKQLANLRAIIASTPSPANPTPAVSVEAWDKTIRQAAAGLPPPAEWDSQERRQGRPHTPADLRASVDKIKAQRERTREARRRRRERKRQRKEADLVEAIGKMKSGMMVPLMPGVIVSPAYTMAESDKAAPEPVVIAPEIRQSALVAQNKLERELQLETQSRPENMTWFECPNGRGRDTPMPVVHEAESIRDARGTVEPSDGERSILNALSRGGVVNLPSGTLTIPADMSPHRLPKAIHNPDVVPFDVLMSGLSEPAPSSPGCPEAAPPTNPERADGAETPAPTNPGKVLWPPPYKWRRYPEDD